jgi:hypothetical protein
MPYPTRPFLRGTLSQALRARLRSVLSLRGALANIRNSIQLNIHEGVRKSAGDGLNLKYLLASIPGLSRKNTTGAARSREQPLR